MELSTAQIRAIENGEAVPVTVGHTKCVLIRADLYERVKAVLDIEDAYPLLDETFREGWDAPGMADYDRYDELKHRARGKSLWLYEQWAWKRLRGGLQ